MNNRAWTPLFVLRNNDSQMSLIKTGQDILKCSILIVRYAYTILYFHERKFIVILKNESRYIGIVEMNPMHRST